MGKRTLPRERMNMGPQAKKAAIRVFDGGISHP
jgi:hypothetical protein